jgi:hypothetical protein
MNIHATIEVLLDASFYMRSVSYQRSVWRYELSKQLQDLHMDVTLLSETHLKPHERLYIVVHSANEEFQ